MSTSCSPILTSTRIVCPAPKYIYKKSHVPLNESDCLARREFSKCSRRQLYRFIFDTKIVSQVSAEFKIIRKLMIEYTNLTLKIYICVQ